jgi:hypothetical protein
MFTSYDDQVKPGSSRTSDETKAIALGAALILAVEKVAGLATVMVAFTITSPLTTAPFTMKNLNAIFNGVTNCYTTTQYDRI